MEININEYYRITSTDDGKSVTIGMRQARTPTEKNPSPYTGWYELHYPNLASAAAALYDRMSNSSDARTPYEIMDHCTKCKVEVVQAVMKLVEQISRKSA